MGRIGIMSGQVRTRAPRGRQRDLPGAARWVVVGEIVAALAASVAVIAVADRPSTSDLAALAVLAVAAAVGQMVRVEAPGNFSYQLSIAFLFAGALLLPAPLWVALAVVAHVPEWIRFRYPWYMQSSNIANLCLSGLAATLVLHAIDPGDQLSSGRSAIAVACAAVAFIVVNHGLLALTLRLARGHRIMDTGLFSALQLGIAAALTSLGTGVALAWLAYPALALIAALPVLLMYQGLRVPALEAETHTDPKTGLANPRRFNQVGNREIGRARRYDRPVSLLMCDVDHMTDINNTHGHLAGDAVLRAVSNALSESVREDDLPARFGGEEFAVLMPEAGLNEAFAAAERIREMVAGLRVTHPANGTLLRVTISVGAASLQPDDATLDDLVHGADLALYAAKAAGRNAVEARGRIPRRESQ